MDAKFGALKGSEVSMTEKKTSNNGEVVVTIPSKQNQNLTAETSTSKVTESNNTSTHHANGSASLKSSPLHHSTSPEIRYSSSPNKSPEVSATNGNLIRRRSLQRDRKSVV